MTQARKRAIWSLLVWGGAAAAFVAAFVAAGGPAEYVQDRTRIVLGAAVLGAAFLAHFVMLWRTRARAGDRPVLSDERDERIARRANGVALVASLVYVFLVCIVLYEVHHDSRLVPVGWMWFLAYSTAMMAYLSHAVATLALDSAMGGHGEG
jgi:uncharacterized membrane protein